MKNGTIPRQRGGNLWDNPIILSYLSGNSCRNWHISENPLRDLAVAGHHRACPSTTLDKIFILMFL